MAIATSLFRQDLRQFPRTDFASLVKKHRGERYANGLTCWRQLVYMLFRHLTRAGSPCEICGGFSCCLRKLD